MRVRIVAAMIIFLAHVMAANAEPAVGSGSSELQHEAAKARDLAAEGKVAEAIAVYESLIEAHPRLPELYNNLAVLYARQGELDSARERLEQALRLHETYATLYDNLSTVYVEMARDSYGKALQLGVTPNELALQELALSSESDVAASPNPENTVMPSVTPVVQAFIPASEEEIKTTLQGWASAWSAQEVELYLSFYDPAFTPTQGISRSDWAEQRRQRVRQPQWVEVTLKDIQVEAADQKQAKVRFVQNYKSDRYSDVSTKEILLQASTEGWRILAEKAY